MKISIALATRNGERFLRDQLTSLIAQTQPPYEIVVSDDASTDRTVEILEDFRAAAPFVVSIRTNQKPVGYAENFLQAAAMCSGDFIAFCDQDDVWLGSKLARCAELARTSGALLLIHRNVVVTEDLVSTRRRVPAFRRSLTASALHVQPWMLVPGNAMFFSRKVLDLDFSRRPRGLGTNDAPMTHDEWTYFIATAIGRTHFSSETLVRYRQHGANVFGAPGRSLLRDSVAPGDYCFLAGRALERSGFFEKLANSASSESDHYRRAADYYHTLATRLEARAAVYSPQARIGRRLRRFARLAANGGYRPRTRGGLGFRSVLKDAIGGVAVGGGSELVRRLTPTEPAGSEGLRTGSEENPPSLTDTPRTRSDCQ
jgi:glycosyltransferase involved in cell wall biosynthesis